MSTVSDNAGNLVAGGSAKAALEFIVKSIVDDKESVVVQAEENGDNTVLRVFVAPGDKGKVIGKRGRVAVAVRTLARAVGARENQNITVNIADD